MRRTMAAGFWSLCLCAPLNVAALGVGDIALESALNQPFSAEIPFESYVESDFDGLSVQLASNDTFERYGLDLPVYLKDFDFTVIDESGRAPFIRVTSARAVSEPFVTLLLDIKWASGRLLREYTVLLDPPIFEAPGPTSTVAPAVAARDTAPRNTGQNRAPNVTQSMTQSMTESSGSSGRSAPAEVLARPRPAAPTATALAEGSYSVQRRDTLWGIAERVSAGSNATVNQAMLALYNANPQAFLGNINLLKAGAILRIPEANDLGAVSASAATATVREQNELFAGGAAAAPARLELRVPGDAGANGDSDTAGDGIAESAQLANRIDALESELSESRRLLDMKDAELAALQRRVAEQDATSDAAPLDGDVAVDDLPLGSALPDDGSAVDLADELDGATDSVFADESVMVDEEDTSAADEGGAVVPTPAPAPAQAVQSAPRSEPSVVSQLLSSVWLWVSAAVVLLLALFLFKRRKAEDAGPFADGFGSTDAEVSDEPEQALGDIETAPGAYADSIVVEESDDLSDFGAGADEPAEAASQTARLDEILDFGSGGEAVADLSDSADTESRLEKTISTGAPLNLDQSDPIAEAEFHMAYGLYDQAADLLERSLESDPDNRAYRVKLLEVYFVWENRDGFLKHARILRDATPDASDADWNKVVILGKQVCPEDEMFAGAVTTAPDSAGIDLEFANDSGDADVDFTLAGGDMEALDADLSSMDDADGSPSEDDALDFDLGSDFDGSDDVEFDLGDSGDEPDTLETPTVEATVKESGLADLTDIADSDETQETPTIESYLADDAATMESPALDTDADSESTDSERTMETPTLESPTLESISGDGDTTEMPALNAGDLGDGDLDDDDLDADTLLADMDTAFGSGGSDDLDVDLSGLAGPDDATVLAPSIRESTGESASDAGKESASDTVEQPQIDTDALELGDTAEQPAIGSEDLMDLDLDLNDAADAGDDDVDDDMATAIQESSLPEDATMTEVGTKLDLARAYIDMGDPDGARSILGEVLDEGADEQQQEARQMLEELGG